MSNITTSIPLLSFKRFTGGTVYSSHSIVNGDGASGVGWYGARINYIGFLTQ